jgi:hypothetical protein
MGSTEIVPLPSPQNGGFFFTGNVPEDIRDFFFKRNPKHATTISQTTMINIHDKSEETCQTR